MFDAEIFLRTVRFIWKRSFSFIFAAILKDVDGCY